ncbi:MAG: SpoIIE family protein phosphatase [Thermodesulfobacteriota bacterium]|nr:SpoIIE family protein phosphatase [Thermodesulfobacteriota bacterium]
MDNSSDVISILIIDDTPVNLKLLEMTLQREGYKVLSATNGPEGRWLAVEESPQLILLDIHMPGEDGFETITRLKENQQTTSIPVLFLTASDETESKIKGFDLGAVDYIVKPFQPMEVLARVRLHLKLSMATNLLIRDQTEKLRQISDAQSAMLVQPEELPAANFSVHFSSLQEAGGDFYEVMQVSENIFVYLVADVSGHDIGTSFLTSSMKALLKQNVSPMYKPAETISMINNVLYEILPAAKYLTLSYLHLNRKTKKLNLVSAAHPPTMHIPSQGEARLIDLPGDPVGIFKNAYFAQHEIKVSKGDRFFIYSDGLLERPDMGKVWTAATHELLPLAEELRSVPLGEAAKKLNDLFDERHEPPDDDIVILAIEV